MSSYGGLFRKISVRFILLILVGALSACGSSDSPVPTPDGGGTGGGGETGSHTTEKAGPTSSGYYFDLTVSPYVVTEGGTVNLSVRVLDENGNVAASVDVNFIGSSDTPATQTTDQWGYAEVALLITGLAGTTGYMTAIVENLSVTVPYQILL